MAEMSLRCHRSEYAGTIPTNMSASEKRCSFIIFFVEFSHPLISSLLVFTIPIPKPKSKSKIRRRRRKHSLIQTDLSNQQISRINRSIVNRVGSSFLRTEPDPFNMKLLDFATLERINNFVSDVCLGECNIKGKVEAYSCKHAKTDKKLSLSLEHEIIHYLGQSSDSDPSSPSDFLINTSSRKTLIYLILTLNQMYPDYDFSAVEVHHLFREEVWDSFKQIFETYLFETAKEWSQANGGNSLLESLYKALDEVVKVLECEIYSFNPDSDGDPFLEKGAIWSFNFFFYNRRLKRVVSFRCCCLSNLAADGFITDRPYYEEDGDEIFCDMDM